jgi:hypothetical protein
MHPEFGATQWIQKSALNMIWQSKFNHFPLWGHLLSGEAGLETFPRVNSHLAGGCNKTSHSAQHALCEVKKRSILFHFPMLSTHTKAATWPASPEI